MWSRARLEDMALRARVLDDMAWMLERFRDTGSDSFYETAKVFGELSRVLKERIDRHDYAAEDAVIDRWSRLV